MLKIKRKVGFLLLGMPSKKLNKSPLMPRHSGQRGFTIIEVIIGIALLGMIFVATSRLIVSYINYRGDAVATSEVNQSLRVALRNIENTVHGATSIYTPAVGASG